MIIKRPLTDEQIKALTQPSQDDINQAANDLIWSLIQRIDDLEAKQNGDVHQLQFGINRSC